MAPSLAESQVQTKRTDAATLIGKDKMKDWFCSLNEREVKGERETTICTEGKMRFFENGLADEGREETMRSNSKVQHPLICHSRSSYSHESKVNLCNSLAQIS